MPDQQTIAETIRQQKARYCRFVDTREWAALASLLKDDVRARMYDPEGTLIASFDTASAFVEAARDFLAGARSIHQVHNSELAFEQDGTVSAIWSMEDYIVGLDAKVGFGTMHGYGHYHETWERIDADRWVIAQLELRRTILETGK
jgi:hypothetical protein